MRGIKIICWSKGAERELAKIEPHIQERIHKKLAELNDRKASRPDIRKLTTPENHYRLRVGHYRVIFTLVGETGNECQIIAVKRRTSTTYLHEESAFYGSTND